MCSGWAVVSGCPQLWDVSLQIGANELLAPETAADGIGLFCGIESSAHVIPEIGDPECYAVRCLYLYVISHGHTRGCQQDLQESGPRNAQVRTDFANEQLFDFSVPGNGATAIERGLMPPGMIAAFWQQAAAVLAEVV